MLLPRALPLLFVAYGALAVLLLAWTVPPFQNVDEVAHFLRAESVARLQPFIPRASDGRAGGAIMSVIPTAAEPFADLRTDPLMTVDRVLLEQATGVRWTDPPVLAGFANTAVYPPFLYLPQAAAIMAGKALGFPVLRTLNLARVLAGLAGVLLGAAAIARAGPGGPALFALLSLPMSLSLLASPSQDALMLPLAALAAAELASALRTGRQTSSGFVLMCLALTLVVTARPPYFPLALLPLAAPGRSLGARLLAACLVAAAAAGWSVAAVAVTGLAPLYGTDPAAQLAHLLQHPSLSLVTATLAESGRLYVYSFLGKLGWMDLDLPRPYYAAAAVQLLVAFALTWGRARAAAPLLVLAAAVGSVATVFAVQYATWTPVGAPTIDGVQGRYFLPVAAMLVALAPGRAEPGPLRRAAIAGISLFPALSIAVAVRALLWRYYLG